ncbi:MAG: hypothetical protein KAH17_04555 [Bacteroidales bacterium]|nr:hypothetical protein [Bacteroidales bacterium]
MKRTVLLLFVAVLLLNFDVGNNRATMTDPTQDINSKDVIRILSSPDLYDLATDWANYFSVEIQQSSILVNNLNNEVKDSKTIPKNHLVLIPEGFDKDLCHEAPWKMIIGRDPIVPIVSSSNPLLESIKQSGVSLDDFNQILSNSEQITWGQLLDCESHKNIQIFIEDNQSVITTLSNFTGVSPIEPGNSGLINGDDLLSLINNNPYAIGFIRLSGVISSVHQSMVKGIELLPIDKNGNGQIDHIEDIYGSSQSFLRGAWIGKYPKALCQNLYVLSQEEPTHETEIAFLKYILTNGQDKLKHISISSLVMSERQANLARLPGVLLPQGAIMVAKSGNKVALISLIAFILLLMIGIISSNYRRIQRTKTSGSVIPAFITLASIKTPKGIFYDKSHTWAYMEKDGLVKVGINDFLQHVTGTLTRVTQKSSGDHVRKGERIMTISHHGKHLHIKSPVTGVIKSENTILATDPAQVNNSPYSNGWVYAIEPSNWIKETQLMLMAEKHKEWLNDEFSRLKDFFQISVYKHQAQFTQVVLSDGGEIKDQVLSQFGPEIWEDFQTQFIDKSL